MGISIPAPPSIQALEAIYREHHRRVRWILRARGIDESAVDDLVHDVFLAVHRRLDTRDREVPLAVWIAGVARNVAFSHRRSRARCERERRSWPDPRPAPDLDEALARNEAWVNLREFIEALPPDQREVFVLVDVLGESMPEVARVCDAGLNTLYSRLRLARRRFVSRFGAAAAKPHAIARAYEEGPGQTKRAERAWALLALELGRGGTAIASLPLLAAKVVGAVAFGGLVLTAVIGGNTDASAPSPAASWSGPLAALDGAVAAVQQPPRTLPELQTSRRSAIVVPPPPAAIAVPAARTFSPPDPVMPQTSAPPPSPPDAGALALEVAALREARRALVAGDPAAALAELDRYVATSGPITLPRERLVIELRAACALDKHERSARAARRLSALGATIDLDRPCTDG